VKPKQRPEPSSRSLLTSNTDATRDGECDFNIKQEANFLMHHFAFYYGKMRDIHVA